MKSWIKESIFITLCAALVITSAYALYRELTVRIDKNIDEAIGVIVFKKKTTERKYSEYVIWEDIATNSPVYNYDSVRTFKGSSAYIRLKSGAEISLDENTMIVIIAEEKGLKINFDYGTVSAKSGETSEKISLNTKDASISTNKGELAVKKDMGVVDVTVSSGEATIDTGDGDIRKIDKKESAQVIKGKTDVRKVSIIPELPSNNSFYITYKNSDSIGFKWNSDSSGEETLQLSRDAKFAKIAYTANSRSRSLTLEVSPGDYYWRIISGKETPQINKFTLLKDSLPEQVYPKSRENVSVSEYDETVSFKWSLSKHASAYEFELAQDAGMQKSIKKIETNQNSTVVEKIPYGQLWWSVSRIYPEGFVLLDTSKFTGEFNIELVTIARVRPKPIHDGEMLASTLTENIILNWEGDPGVKDYTVDISSDKGFKKIIKSSQVSSTHFNAGKMEQGKYYWRITSNYIKGEPLVSEVVPLVVTPPGPVVYLYPENGNTLSNPSESLKFSWKDDFNFANYLFEISDKPDFTKPIASSRTETLSYTLKNPGAGKFYWRVSIIEKSGGYIAEGGIASFVIPDVLQKPSPLLPVNMSVINLDNLDVIKFQWKKVPGAASYEIEIFQRAYGIDRSLVILNTDTPMLELRNFKILNPGTLAWIVRAKKFNKSTVSALSESDQNYFVLKVNEDIPAPKSNVPGTIYVR